MRLKIGDQTRLERTILEEDLEAFAKMSLDRNRIHFDNEFAKQSYFGKPIAHGMIGAALISGALTKLMGDGNLWLDAKIKFQRPIFVGDILQITLSVQEINHRGVITIDVSICNKNDEIVILGEVKSMQIARQVKEDVGEVSL
jgi:acyl dehydratase